VGGVKNDGEIVKIWKDYLKGILNSENSASESAEFVEHSTDFKENYLVGPEMAMYSVVSLTSLLWKLPLNTILSAEHLLCAGESLCFFISLLFNMYIVRGRDGTGC